MIIPIIPIIPINLLHTRSSHPEERQGVDREVRHVTIGLPNSPHRRRPRANPRSLPSLEPDLLSPFLSSCHIFENNNNIKKKKLL